MPAATPQYDKERLKGIAHGRWPEILHALAGVSPDILDGNDHPCPKCGGDDRFRSPGADVGWLRCRHCFSVDNFDGFDALKWLNGWEFPQAIAAVANHLNVLPEMNSTNESDRPREGIAATSAERPKESKESINPAKNLRFSLGFSKYAAGQWCEKKPGTTIGSLITIGTRDATYSGKHSALVIPVYGTTDVTLTPIGWVMIERTGQGFPEFDKQDKEKITGYLKIKLTAGSESGFVNKHALQVLSDPVKLAAVKIIWKAEGVTDLLAIQAFIPPHLHDTHLVFSNSHGAGGKPNPWILDLFASCPALEAFYVVHDRDDAGQNGATGKTTKQGRKKTFTPGWCQYIRDSITAPVKNVELPFPMTESNGKDARDWISEPNPDGSPKTYEQLLSLAEKGKLIGTSIAAAKDAGATIAGPVTPPTETPRVPLNPTDQPDFFERQIVGRLLLTVLGEFDNGKVKVFADGKTHIIPEVSKLSYERILQICGEHAKKIIDLSAEPAQGKVGMSQVRQAIALLSGLTRISDENESGAGIWRGRDARGIESTSVIVVSAGASARWDSASLEFTRIREPLTDGRVLDLGTSIKCCEFDELKTNVELAGNTAWCEEVLIEYRTLLERWAWKNQDQSPTVVVGMTLATMMQKMWDWRPHVFVMGESNTGKSLFFDVLETIFGNLAAKSSSSSAIGIQQHIGCASLAVIIDEFEQNKYRASIYEALRGASRGDSTFKGTVSHKSKTLSMCVCGWVASTESGLQKEQDINRFIMTELIPPAAEDHGKLSKPHPQVLQTLGQKLFAITVRHSIAAVELARELKPTHIPGVHPRMVENFSAPVAILATAYGMDHEQATDMLRSLLQYTDAEPIEKNHNRLLQDILASHLALDHGQKMPVGSAIALVHNRIDESSEGFPYQGCPHDEALQQNGIKVLGGFRGKQDGVRVLSDDKKFFLAPELVLRFLLKGTEWENQNLANHLLRIEKAEKGRRRMCGTFPRGIILPLGDLISDEKTEIEENEKQELKKDAQKPLPF